MDKPDLKPCPFCGNEQPWFFGACKFKGAYVSCGSKGCGCATTEYDTDEAALQAWNQRAPAAAPAAGATGASNG